MDPLEKELRELIFLSRMSNDNGLTADNRITYAEKTMKQYHNILANARWLDDCTCTPDHVCEACQKGESR